MWITERLFLIKQSDRFKLHQDCLPIYSYLLKNRSNFHEIGGELRMSKLSTQLLMESYIKAKDLKLCPDFICLLEKEIRRRSLSI